MIGNVGVRSGSAQKGFTLIEMSIVLVIIGLIIGGILKGQEIIESSRQKNLLVAMDAVRSSVTTFFDRYQALPGDFATATSRISSNTAMVGGDGNGIIGASTAAGTTDMDGLDGGSSENEQFWNHLNFARLIGGVTPSKTAATTFGDNSPLPAAAFPGSGFVVIYGKYNDLASDTRIGHWLRVNKKPASAAGVLSPKTMYALEVKADDGVPVTGNIRSGLDATGCGTTGGTADYDATIESGICTLFSFVAN